MATGNRHGTKSCDGDDDALGREVTHRWAHLMARHTSGPLRRYGATGSRLWVPRRR